MSCDQLTESVQYQEVEEELRSRAERAARLQHISSWTRDRQLWMDSALMPSSRTELQRSISVCQVSERTPV